MRILAVGAHPDDIEFMCAGTLVKYVKRGDKVIMAIATNGEVGSTTLSKEEISKIRREEARASASVIGAELIWMDLPDEYVDISDVFEIKKQMLSMHKSQESWLRDQYDMTPLEFMEIIARFRGIQAGCKYAEAFRKVNAWPRITSVRLLP